jgi:hypothetical protein
MAGRIFINYRRVKSLKDAELLSAHLVKAFGGNHSAVLSLAEVH